MPELKKKLTEKRLWRL